MRLRPSGDDILGVIVSLAIAVGMVVGALTVMWITGNGPEKVA